MSTIKRAHFYWVYCLKCKEPMYGVKRPYEAEGSHRWTCGHCSAVNVFSNSLQPVELTRALPVIFALQPH